MTAKTQLSIKGSLKKFDSIWIAEIPQLKMSSHGQSPSDCIESLKKNICYQLQAEAFSFELKVSDDCLLVMTSLEEDLFQSFIDKRQVNLLGPKTNRHLLPD